MLKAEHETDALRFRYYDMKVDLTKFRKQVKMSHSSDDRVKSTRLYKALQGSTRLYKALQGSNFLKTSFTNSDKMRIPLYQSYELVSS